MPARPHQSFARSAAFAGAGVAGLATLFVAPAAAHAAPTPASDTAGATTESSSTSTPDRKAEAVAPDYGYQKYRVGVRGKQGDYFPPGTSTAKTEFAVTITPRAGEAKTTTCFSDANTPDVVTDATFCPGDGRQAGDFSDRRAKSVNEPSQVGSRTYVADPGATITVTQTTVNNGLVKDTSTATLAPCVLDDDDVNRICGTQITEGNFDLDATTTDLVFVDPGIPPVALDDSAKTKEGVPVTIDIKRNDVPNVAPLTSVNIVGDPENGTAKLITAESADPTPAESSAPPQQRRQAAGSRKLAAVTSYRAIYTPKAGFTGVDRFRYTITTQNGTATATVTVTVTGLAAAPSETAGTGVSANTDDLAETGTQSGDLVGYGAALLAAGAGALAIGQKRRRGRHAR